MHKNESVNIKELKYKLKDCQNKKESVTLSPMEIEMINLWIEIGEEYKRKHNEANIIYNIDKSERKEKRARQAIEHLELDNEERREKEIINKKMLSEYISLINEFDMKKDDAIQNLNAKYNMTGREATIKRIQREKQEKINEGIPSKAFEGLLPPNWPTTQTS